MSTWEERLQDPEIQKALKFISATPECLSVLYDLNLLPEQTMKDPHQFIRTLAFAGLFQRIAELEDFRKDEQREHRNALDAWEATREALRKAEAELAACHRAMIPQPELCFHGIDIRESCEQCKGK